MTAHERTVRLVAIALGAIAFVFAGGIIFMFWIMLVESRGKDAIDPSVVAVFGTICTLAGASVAGLAGLITSTRQSAGDAPPPPVVEDLPVVEAPVVVVPEPDLGGG